MHIAHELKMPKYEYQKEDNRVGSADYSIPLIDKILAAEAHMKLMPQIELKVFHHFSHGVYARELHIPAGTILTGEVHKFENLNILSKGRISVSTEHGIEEIEASSIIVSPPGTKRIAHAITDCIWTTIHGTFETDVEKIRATFIAHDYQDFIGSYGQQLRLEL